MGQVWEDEGGVGVHAVFHKNPHFTGTDDQGNAYVGNGRGYWSSTAGQCGWDGFEEVSQPITLVEVSQGAAPNFT